VWPELLSRRLQSRLILNSRGKKSACIRGRCGASEWSVVGLFRAFPISRVRAREGGGLACLAGWANYTMTAPPCRQNSRCLRNSRDGCERRRKIKDPPRLELDQLIFGPGIGRKKGLAFSFSLSRILLSEQSQKHETKNSTMHGFSSLDVDQPHQTNGMRCYKFFLAHIFIYSFQFYFSIKTEPFYIS